jgi:VIT1/CCC1 family predicted Fe2+/Mn2+ transporter
MTAEEIHLLLGASNEVFYYKLMLSRAFLSIAQKTGEKRSRQLLIEISENENSDANNWEKSIRELQGGNSDKPAKRLVNLRVRIMMAILGPRGFIEWLVIAEDDVLEQMIILAENLQDKLSSERWGRIVGDERLHIERMKQELLGMVSWEMGGGGGVRDVVFGANDGLVSILALVAGVFGAYENSQLVLITGIAGAIAGTVSMGAGAYVSAKSEQEVTSKEQRRKGIKGKGSPQKEIDELVRFYTSEGFTEQTARSLASRVSERLGEMEELTIGEQTGLLSDQDWPPIKAGMLTGLSFLVASLVPILPFAFLEINMAAVTALVASVFFLFMVGASKAVFTRQNWIRSGLEVMLIGIVAAMVTYLIGLLIPE